MMTSSARLGSGCLPPPPATGARLATRLAFDQVEMPVRTPHQNRDPIGAGIAVDHVVLRSFHFQHRLFQGHGLAAAITVVDAKDLLAVRFARRRSATCGLSFFAAALGSRKFRKRQGGSPGFFLVTAAVAPLGAQL